MSIRYRKTKRALKAAGHLARAALLLCALSAAAIAIVWTTRPELVARAEGVIFSRYERAYKADYQRSMELVRSGRLNEAAEALEGLLSRMGEVRKQDRLVPSYASVVSALANIYERQGRGDEAARASKALVVLDPNSYAFWLEHAMHLGKAGQKDASIEALEKAFGIAPHSAGAAASLAEALYREGRQKEARAAIERHLASNRSINIRVQWGSAEDKKPATALFPSVAVTGKAQSFRFPVAGSPARVILTLSQAEQLRLRLERVSIITANGRAEALSLAGVMADELETLGGLSFETAGQSPALIIDLPAEAYRDEQAVALEIGVSFRPFIRGLGHITGGREGL